MAQVIVITGPTATGKTDLALHLAERINAEIISADSMLVYKEPRIITSKPSLAALAKTKHHFVGIVSVKNSYDVFEYFKKAREVVISLHMRNIPVIICGGSGLYIRVLLEGISELPGGDYNLRKQLKEKAGKYGKQYLLDELKSVDPDTASNLSANDLKRIIRALEVYYLTGKPIQENKGTANGLYEEIPINVLGLRMERNLLYEKINQRVDEMFKQGAIDEVTKLLKLNLSRTAEKIIGIPEIRSFLNKELTEAQARERMKQNTRNFAKRQFTWFNRDKRIKWINMGGKGIRKIADFILN